MKTFPTVAELRDFLDRFADHYQVNAYEGEGGSSIQIMREREELESFSTNPVETKHGHHFIPCPGKYHEHLSGMNVYVCHYRNKENQYCGRLKEQH